MDRIEYIAYADRGTSKVLRERFIFWVKGTDVILDEFYNEVRETPRHKWKMRMWYSRNGDQRMVYPKDIIISEEHAKSILEPHINEILDFVRNQFHIRYWSEIDSR